MTARFTSTAAALALVAALLATPAAAAPRRVPPQFFGANWDGPVAFAASDGLQDQQFARMAAAGVESVRTAFSWADAQGTQGASFDFSRSDRIVSLASAHGIAVLPIVIEAPSWARQDPNAAFSPPRSAFAYASYLTALIGRYGPQGTFWAEHPELQRLPISTWQIWNEPHLPFQWTVPPGTDWASGYAHLLRVAYKAAKRADPAATVVLAGMTNQSPSFLARLYRAGVHGYFDIAAIHPYTREPRGVLSLVSRFRAVMTHAGDGRKRLWVTELGLPASQGKAHSSNMLQTTDGGMARFLSQSYAALIAARRQTHVARVYWYTWASEYSGDIFRFTGLMRFSGGDSFSTEPAYGSYVTTAQRYEGCAKSETGACR